MSGQYCVDANIFIEPWYTLYLEEIFKSLWVQLANHRDEMILIKPIYDQIEPISSNHKNLVLDEKREKYPLRMWLEENEFSSVSVDDTVEALSLRLVEKYGIESTPRGADEVDIKLISYTKKQNETVVTLEGKQVQEPKEKKHYKIPLICQEENVHCINFVEMFKGLQIRI